MAAVRSSGCALRFAADSLRGDRRIVLAAVSQDGNALRYTCLSLRADAQVVLAAASNCGMSIQHAAPHLRRDTVIGATAMIEDQRALGFIPQELWSECFEEAQRISSRQLLNSSELEKSTLSSEAALARLIRYLPCCFGGLAGCLVGPFVAAGLALPSWAACLGTASAGMIMGAKILDGSEQRVDAVLNNPYDGNDLSCTTAAL
eukprot:symbB.v1.2.024459.t1/scaffold2266.1/size83935/2